MSTPKLPALATVGIWLVSVIGFAMMTTVLVGALFDDVLSCGQPEWVRPTDRPVATTWAWIIIGLGAAFPVLVAAAVAPTGRRRWVLPVAVLVAAGTVGLAAQTVGDCLR